MPTYTIPAKPKDDNGHLELIARIIFVIGFKYAIVVERWPLIKKAFYGFDVEKVSKAKMEKIVGSEGMIKNRVKISRIIENAAVCKGLISEHGSMKKWVQTVVKRQKEDPIFAKSLAEECQERFIGIGKTTREWLAHVYADGPKKPERRVVEPPRE